MISLKTIFILALIVVIQVNADSDSFLDQEDALEFLENKRALEAEARLLYTPKEQRREVREKYEEKCERKFINKARKKPRWCPPLDDWPEWQQATRDDGPPKKGIFGRK